MIVDLNPLPYRTAIDIIRWCVAHKVDMPKCLELCNALSVKGAPQEDWTIDIPDKYVTFFLLAFPWNLDGTDD